MRVLSLLSLTAISTLALLSGGCAAAEGGSHVLSAVNSPDLATCSADGGCPMSAMAYATGSFTDEFLLSEAALQSAQNMSLNIHLCCGYTIRGELLTNLTQYKRFLVELLHVSPLAHLSVKEQLRIFPHERIALIRQSGAADAQRYTPADFAADTPSNQVPDGDILTLEVAPQGPDFRLMPAAKAHRYANHRPSRPAEAEQYGVDYSDLHYNDPNHLLQGSIGDDYNIGGINGGDDLVTEFQMFIPNFAIHCKCPHTLPVLPLLKFRRDTLPRLELEGLGAKCITNDAHTTPAGPWSRVMYSVGSQYAAQQHASKGGSNSNSNSRFNANGNALRTARGISASEEGEKARSPAVDTTPLTAAELQKVVLTPDSVVAHTYFSVAPAQIPAFARLQWRLYEVSESFGAEIIAATYASRNGGASSAGAAPSDSVEPELYGKHQHQQNEDGSFAPFANSKVTVDEQNFRIRFPNETSYKLLSAAEKELLLKSDSKTDRLRLVAQTTKTTTMTSSDATSDVFAIRPNVKYLVTVDVRRGDARQVLRGLFVLRLPAWLANPARFLTVSDRSAASIANGVPPLVPLTMRHDHVLFGKQMKLDFSQLSLADVNAGAATTESTYRRVWAPLMSAASQQVRNEDCLQKFKTLHKQLEERRRVGEGTAAAASAVSSSMFDMPSDQHSDYFALFASVESRVRLERLRKARLDAALTKEADRLHAMAMADAMCSEVFAVLEEKLRKGQPLRLEAGALSLARMKASGSSGGEVYSNPHFVVPEQFRHLRDPTAAVFSYDVNSRFDAEGVPASVLIDHLEDGSFYAFPTGSSSVSVWLVDSDGACNATRVEVADVHTLRPIVSRPVAEDSTVCTRVANLEAEGINQTVAAVKRLFKSLGGSDAAFDATAEWKCYDETLAATKSTEANAQISDRATVDKYLKAHEEALRLPVTVSTSAYSSSSSAVVATVNMTAQSTARCFMTLKASNLPKLDGSTEKWLHIDEASAVVTRAPSYFSPSQDIVLESSVTIHCRAFSLPHQIYVDVDTKDARFTVTGLPTTPNGRWEVQSTAPVRFLHTAAGSDANAGAHVFELMETDMFDIALDEVSRNVPARDRSYALQQNITGRYAYIVLSPKSILFKVNYDPSGTCPEGEVEVVVRLLQTPPAPAPSPAEEVFVEDPCVLLARPRAPTSDEVVEWSPIRSTDVGSNAVAAGFFGESTSAAAREEADNECQRNLRITYHDNEDAALNGELGVSPFTHGQFNRRVANNKRFIRVCGIPEGTSCAVQWRSTNAAGTVAMPTVIHRCRLPPTVNFYSEAPQLKAASTFSRRMVYDSTHMLRPALTIAGNITLLPVVGSKVRLFYRLASSDAVAHTPLANDHTLTEAGRMRVLIEFDSASRFPYIYNVTAVAGVKPYEAHAKAREVALQQQKHRQLLLQQHNRQEALLFKGKTPIDTETVFGNGIIELNCPANVLQNDDKSVCSAAFTDLGNSTRQLFIATVEVEAASDSALAANSLSTQSIRVREEFQKRRLCRMSHRPFAIYSLSPEAVLSLQEHPATREENEAAIETRRIALATVAAAFASGSGESSTAAKEAAAIIAATPLKIRFCTPEYHFALKREMFATLGYESTFTCAPSADGKRKGFSIQKLGETETVITPLVKGESSASCVFTMENHATKSKESVPVEITSVSCSRAADTMGVYLLPDVAADITALGAKELAAKYPTKAAAIQAGDVLNAAVSSSDETGAEQKPAAATTRAQRYQALSTKKQQAANGNTKNKADSVTPAALKAAAKGAVVAVGRTVDLLAYSQHVAPFSGHWHVLNMVPTRDAHDLRTTDIVTQGGYLSTVRIRETAADLGCVDRCVSGTLSSIPASGFYTVGYAFPDTANPDICPPSNITRTVHVFLAEVVDPEVVSCVSNVTIKAAPLPLAHRADHYGRWSIVTFHTSATDVSPYPEEFITFDNAYAETTVVRGLRFGVLRLRWNIYRNGTDELLDSAVMTIKVLTDSLPSDRIVTFKDTAIVPTTSSAINWRAMRSNIRVSFRQASSMYDPAVSGELHVSQLPLGTTRLRYDAVRSARAASFPTLAHLECPKRSQGDFYIERVAASLTAGTTMRVECHAYSGQGVITIRLATGGSDDIRLVGKDQLQSLIFNGTAKLQQDRPRCTVPWWAREQSARWTNVSYFDSDRAVNITVRATEYLSKEELETTPVFATSGYGCPESGGFVSSSVIEGVPHDGHSALYVPIVDPISARLHSTFFLRPIEGKKTASATGESQLSSGNASVDISLGRGASFGFRSNETLLMSCLRGEVPLSAIAKPWRTVGPTTTHRGTQSWDRYVESAGSLNVRCEPLVFLPHGSSAQSMTIGQLEDQLQVIHRDTVQTLRNRDGIDVHGLSRSTQMALAARRVTSTQLAEILHRNRRMEAERLARARNQETDAERFERVMRLSSSVFGDDAVVTAIRVFLPAYPPFFTTEDILLNIEVAKATVCSIPKNDPGAPSNASGFGQSTFGQLLIEDEPVLEEVTPNAFSQCEFESRAPAFNLNLRNGAFRPDASLSTCRIELIDDGLVNASMAASYAMSGGASSSYGLSVYDEYNNGRGPISSDIAGGNFGTDSRDVGLHACFRDFLKGASLTTDPLSQKKMALQISACPDLKMIDLEEYNSFTPQRRIAFLRRMTQPHHMRVVLHNCVIPDKHTHPKAKRGFGANAYVDGVFNVVVKPTMAHLRVLSNKNVPAVQQQLVDPESAELDRLLLCESDVQERGALIGIELSGDRWHPAVGERPAHGGGHGSRNVAMLNSFSVVEKEEYLMMQRNGESIYDYRRRIAKLVDSRYDTSDDTFANSYNNNNINKEAREAYESLAHASSGARATTAVKVSKFMHYMYRQFWAQQNSQQQHYGGGEGGGTNVRPLVTRHNDTFVTVQIPEDSAARGRAHTMQSYERYSSGYGSSKNADGVVVIDSNAWGFGGVIEEIRIAVPGVTTSCHACLLTDFNFYFVGDFAGSVSLFSQRALPNRLMAARDQLDAPLRLALSQLEEDRPLVFLHHWLCPNTAAKRLQTLMDIARGPQYDGGLSSSSGNANHHHVIGPIVELVVQIDLGRDTPSLGELHSLVGGAEDVLHMPIPAASAIMRTSIVMRNATLPSGELSGEVHATVVMRSAQASALPSRILHELEVSLQMLPETLSVGHRVIAAAMRKRKNRLGYLDGRRDENLAFSGVVTLRTCINGGGAADPNCIETASRGIDVGPWEAEVAPVVSPQHGATMDRSYVAESQRHMNRVVHTVRSGFVLFLLFVAHHLVTAYVVLRVRTALANAAITNGADRLDAAGGGAFVRGRSPDPNSDSFNVANSFGGPADGGYAAQRSRSISLSDLDGPSGSNTAIFICTFVVAAVLAQYTFMLWVMCWMGMWAIIIVAQRARYGLTFAAFVMHFMIFLAAIRQ